jgi:hypothetical protein
MVDANSSQAQGPMWLRGFLAFFRGYMGLWSVVTAALPIPVTYAGAIPIYTAQKAFLSTYTSLFCFLVLGFLFYSRHSLARHMFPEFFRKRDQDASVKEVGRRMWNTVVSVLPLMLIFGCFCAVYLYHTELVFSLRMTSPSSKFLQEADLQSIPNQWDLMLDYLLIFLTAECAFALMALKEYLQDLLGLSDLEITGGRSA